MSMLINDGFIPEPTEREVMDAAAMEAECARIMAMPDDEIDAELRDQGIDPDEAAEKGRTAVSDALLEVQTFKAADASLELSRAQAPVDGDDYLLRLTVGHASFGICKPREYTEAMSLKFAFRRALLTLLRTAKEAGQTEAYAEGRKDESTDRDGYVYEAMGLHQFLDLMGTPRAGESGAVYTLTGRTQAHINAVAGWRPIETAPEDEHILIATTGGHVGTAYWTDEGDGKVWAWGHPTRDGGQYLHPNLTPLRWMPLPKHPEAA